MLTVLAMGVLIGIGAPSPANADLEAEAPSADAAWYAETYGVTLEEAAQYLDLEVLAGQLDAALSKNEADSFGGLWINHEPEFTVQVRMLPGTEGLVGKYVDPLGMDLTALVRVKARDITLEELAKQQAEAPHADQPECGLFVPDQRGRGAGSGHRLRP